MRVTFDSNAWEKIFDPADQRWLPVKDALTSGKCLGFICETAFRIEAIRKSDRPSYFAQPAMAVEFPFDIEWIDGKPCFRIMSTGPDDSQHPGLPEIQSQKLSAAFAAGVRLLRGAAWMGLPVPLAIQDPALFALADYSDRKQRQTDIQTLIEARGVGKAAFDAVGGWQIVEGVIPPTKPFQKACAEWSDGEMVAAHIAYRNDVLCTNDYGRGAGISILDETNRAWLATTFDVRFMTLEELRAHVLGE